MKPMNTYSEDFLKDLAKLLRHGPEPLQTLISDLSNVETRTQFINQLSRLAELSGQMSRPKKPKQVIAKTNIRLDEKLQSLRNKNPQQYELLKKLHEQLLERVKTLERSLLLRVCNKLGIHITSKMTRTVIVGEIISKLAELEHAPLEQALKDVADLDRGSSAEFLKLAAFITGT